MSRPAPNILLILTDQQRWDTLAAAGFGHMHTPNLDTLARQGTLFTNAYCNSPVCMPSRHSLLSGQYPSAIGSTCNGIEMDPDVPCVQHLLSAAGYHTANLGKLHFLNHAHRDHRWPHPQFGFDAIAISDEPGCYEDAYIAWVRDRAPDEVERCRVDTPPAWTGAKIAQQPREVTTPYPFAGSEELTHSAFVASRTIETIERQQGQNWFAIAGFYAPHTPLNPPARFLDLYDPASLPPPVMNEADRARHGLTDAQWAIVRQHYYALVSHVDDQVGRILRALEETGQADNTLVVFTSDHGEHLGDHGLVQKGPPGYESCVHVPLIARWPGVVEAGTRREELVELIDVTATLLEAARLPKPPMVQGRSFLPLLRGGSYEPRSSIFLEHHLPEGDGWRTIRTSAHKYARHTSGGELLFDLEADPHELHNLAAEVGHDQTLTDIRHELLRRWDDVSRPPRPRTGEY